MPRNQDEQHSNLSTGSSLEAEGKRAIRDARAAGGSTARRLGSQELWRDESGRSLEDYPRPSVAVDVAVLTVPDPLDLELRYSSSSQETESEGGLHVLLVLSEIRSSNQPLSKPSWSLPGTFLHDGETLIQATNRALLTKAGIKGLHPRQLKVFDELRRDPRGRVLSVGHFELVNWEKIRQAVLFNPDIRLRSVRSVAEKRTRVRIDHREIVSQAAERVQADYRSVPDPYRLLAEPFTLRDLESLHRRIDPDGTPAKDTFRRRMMNYLVDTESTSSGSIGKPARLFENNPSRTGRNRPT